MNLLIVESPSKAKTIGKYLGGDWQVRASVGHFRDLAKKPKDGLGVDLTTFKPDYEIQNAKVVAGLRKAAKSASHIVLATDPDREGEAIAWHLSVVLKLRNAQRATFNEITPDAVKKAVAAPRFIDNDLVFAQEARRVLDRLIGYKVSPRLGSGESAGRVQSPGLRLVVDRERAIKQFQSTCHFGVQAMDAAGRFTAEWDTKQVLLPDQKYVTDQALADRIASTVALTVTGTEQKQRRANPPKPFWTSTLQQAASSQLKMRPEDTMKAAQGLYEAGHITYLRTDTPRIAEEAQTAIRAYLQQVGKPIPDKAPTYKAKADAQEAHECIRPTHIDVKMAGETDHEQQLYRLVRLRTLASQMTAAIYDVTTADFNADVMLDDGTPARFHAKGETLIHPGWKAAIAIGHDSEDEEPEKAQAALPPMNKGDRVGVTCKRLDKSTKPPSRYTEATLTKALEARGIGRPSTYAAIVTGMRKRGYVAIKSRKLYATQAGCIIIDKLVQSQFSFLDYDYTRILEGSLDEIAEGRAQYYGVVAASYQQLMQELDALPDARPSQSEPDQNVLCPTCESPMRRIPGKKKNEAFWGCSGYPDCKTTLRDNAGEPVQREAPVISETQCPHCGGDLIRRTVRKGKRKGSVFWGCANYPKCSVALPDDDGVPGERPQQPKKHAGDTKCPDCGADMYERFAHKGEHKGGAFLGCSKYPKCKKTLPIQSTTVEV